MQQPQQRISVPSFFEASSKVHTLTFYIPCPLSEETCFIGSAVFIDSFVFQLEAPSSSRLLEYVRHSSRIEFSFQAAPNIYLSGISFLSARCRSLTENNCWKIEGRIAQFSESSLLKEQALFLT